MANGCTCPILYPLGDDVRLMIGHLRRLVPLTHTNRCSRSVGKTRRYDSTDGLFVHSSVGVVVHSSFGVVDWTTFGSRPEGTSS